MFTFSMPTTALFGAGKLNELHAHINTPTGAVRGRKALVVISNGKSTRANGSLDRGAGGPCVTLTAQEVSHGQADHGGYAAQDYDPKKIVLRAAISIRGVCDFVF